jgi:hypothetical protein
MKTFLNIQLIFSLLLVVGCQRQGRSETIVLDQWKRVPHIPKYPGGISSNEGDLSVGTLLFEVKKNYVGKKNILIIFTTYLGLLKTGYC